MARQKSSDRPPTQEEKQDIVRRAEQIASDAKDFRKRVRKLSSYIYFHMVCQEVFNGKDKPQDAEQKSHVMRMLPDVAINAAYLFETVWQQRKASMFQGGIDCNSASTPDPESSTT